MSNEERHEQVLSCCADTMHKIHDKREHGESTEADQAILLHQLDEYFIPEENK